MVVPERVAIETGQTISRPSSSISGFAICVTQASSSKPPLSDAHHDGQAIAIVALVAKHEAGIAQSFQDSVDGGARQADFVRDLRYRRAVAHIEHRQRIKAAHQRADWAC